MDRIRRGEGRRRTKHVFRPSLDGRLEDRNLMSRVALPWGNALYHPIQTLVRNGGKGVRILNGMGSAFDVRLTGPGAVTAKPLYNGTVQINVHGSNATTELVVDPVTPRPRNLNERNQAHVFHPEFGVGNNVLDIGRLEIKSGMIGQVLGYRTANLSGPLVIAGTTPVDRIALNRLLPGATIVTGGDLNTLDVFSDANLSGANTGLNIGRDLNLLNVGGSLTLSNGANVVVGRDVGNTPQPAKGTGTGSDVLQSLFNRLITTSSIAQPLVGGYIQGDMNVEPGSLFVARRYIDQFIFVLGSLNGQTRVTPPTLPFGNTTPSVLAQGGATP